MRPFGERLLDELAEMRTAFRQLLDGSSICNVDPNRHGVGGMVFIGFATWDWTPDDGLIGERTRLLERLDHWASLLLLLHRSAVPTTRERIEGHLGLLRDWLKRDGGDHSIPPTIEEASARAEVAFDELVRLVEIGIHGMPATLVVPDTNALIRHPDVASFAAHLGTDDYLVVMPTTVVAELDELKDRGRTEDVRTKAAAVVRRLKGLRDRGDIRVGVPVQGRTRLRMEHREVQVRGVLDWLDPDVPDDRILAAALDLQARSPAATVVLFTADMNLQNKAAAVGLPFADPAP
ncbi:MAG: PIN domain-containing protein [Acidimicrobiia bacterium]